MLRSSFSFLISCICFFCFLNWSCTKIDNTSIGSELLPVVDNVNTFDTFLNVVAVNIDSISNDCAKIYPLDDHLLGNISNDPYFGTTLASIYIELKPSAFPFIPPAATGITLDSAVLVLSYKRTYGDSVLPQKVNVYEVSTPGFKFDSSSCTAQTYDPLLLGSAIYSPKNLNDSVNGFRESYANELRIKLSNEFAQSILSQDSSTAFKSDSLFKDFFKGFAIVPDESFGGSALSYFSIADTNTKLAIYFKNTVNNVVDTTVINFRLTTTSATANNILRNHNGAEIESHLSKPAAGDDLIYIQTTPGTYADLKIPALSVFPNRIIHRAELIMQQVYSPDPVNKYLSAPDFLYLEIKNTDSTRKPIPCDFNVSSGQPNFQFFGGFRRAAIDLSGNAISTYTFDISRYIQKIITNGITNYSLKLSSPDYILNPLGYVDECGQGIAPFNYLLNSVAMGRVKLGGGNNQDYQMKLRIIYSNL